MKNSSLPPPTASPAPPAEPPLSGQRVRDSETEIPQIQDEPSIVWDWDNLLDFTFDDQLNISWHPEDQRVGEAPIQSSELAAEPSDRGSDVSDRIRKRDPRLICDNFLAGRIPCSCPEVDEKEEEGEVGKKRARLVTARCQVPSCEADISELKGYHRRHRVCLTCANANAVVLDGQCKRYCQQCGKFHILPDFDEGKRSCRRKLERHNKRRRRKSTDFKSVVEKETQGDQPVEDITCEDGEEKVLEYEDRHVSPLSPLPSSQNNKSDSVMSFVASGETPVEGRKDNSKYTLSSSFGDGDNKNAYSSVCPTGRISFKLYDWNPAEFPRRLRHQIFQWLASMPVDLEGYIRPGCTILTVFITMPRFMWEKLNEDAASYIHDFFKAPESMLFGRGSVIVYVNDMIFRVLTSELMSSGTSLMSVKEVLVPRLHYVHPTFFEAGKPMEFIACGSNLLQPKFRFLVSFAGRYLAYDYCLSIPHGMPGLSHGNEEDPIKNSGHQLYKIHIPKTDPKLFGPAFIEVENESGLSNFIPVLFGNRQICSEMLRMQQRFDISLHSRGPQSAVVDAISESCEVFVSRQTAISELLLDIAWSLKEPKLEDVQDLLTSTQIRRLNCLLNILIWNESTVTLEKILQSLKVIIDSDNLYSHVTKTNNTDMKLFQKYIDHARELVHQRLQRAGELELHLANSVPNCFSQNNNDRIDVVPSSSQDIGMAKEKSVLTMISTFHWSSETVPLVGREILMNVNYRPNLGKVWPKKSRGQFLSSTILGSRPLFLIVATAAVCFGICVVLLHPHKVGEFAVSIHRCLFRNSNT